MPPPTLLYADPFAAGHRTEHLAFYLRLCRELGVRIIALVPASVWDGTVHLAGATASDAEHVSVEIAQETFAGKMRFLGDLGQIARERAADLILFPTLDPFLFAMAARRLTGRALPVPWSGVFFADCFSYLAEQIDWPKRLVKSAMKYAAMRLALCSNCAGLMTLNKNWRMKTRVPVTWLPDSFSSLDQMAAAAAHAEQWPIPRSERDDSGRIRFLLFGALQPRKGLTNVAQAFLSLSDAELSRVEFSALGKFDADGRYKAEAEALFAQMAQRGAKVQMEDAYVDVETLDHAVRRSDVVLMPYQGHIGSSGVMNIAAQYGRPVIAQHRYQLGQEVRDYDLGLSVETTRTDDLAKAVRGALAGKLTVTEGMRRFRNERTPEQAHAVAHRVLAGLLHLNPGDEGLHGVE
jgi:glycosyltransferase involved in cell wall biosynthesis